MYRAVVVFAENHNFVFHVKQMQIPLSAVISLCWLDLISELNKNTATRHV